VPAGACSLHALQVGLQSKSPRGERVITIGADTWELFSDGRVIDAIGDLLGTGGSTGTFSSLLFLWADDHW